MAKMYGRSKGKSGSTKPSKKENPTWVSDLNEKEVTGKIVELYNQGKTPSEIGEFLRDQDGVPSVKTFMGKRIVEVLNENKLTTDFPHDLLSLINRSVILVKHMKDNKKDFTAKRGYQLTVSKIRRLVKYYAKKDKIPKGWRYTPDAAALLVK